MLVELHLKNLAIFEDERIVFGEGLNVITGEPGSGKSLVAGSIGLLLGAKADADRIRSGADEAEVEALFSADAGVESQPAEMQDGELVLRRSLRRSGRGGAAINGGLAATAQLVTLALKLVSLVGQHEHQRLLDPDWHQILLDRSAGLWDVRRELKALVGRWRELEVELATLRSDAARRDATLARIAIELAEIERVAPKPGEDADLAREREVLRHAGELTEVAARGRELLYEGDQAALTLVERVRAELTRAQRLDPALTEVTKLLEPAEIALKEAGRALISYGSAIDADPDRLESIEARLNALERVKRTHGGTLAEVLETAATLRVERARLEREPGHLDTMASELAEAKRAARLAARTLSERRSAHATVLASAIERELETLGMEGCRFRVEIASPISDEECDPRPDGWDDVRFLIAPNQGEDLKPLDRIASGGELSRLFLALSRHLEASDERPSFFFDEVDAGIGGAVAEVVGQKLREIARHTQVLCVTHLPQIACLGDRHIKLWKETVGARTVAHAEEVRGEARVREVARMLGGAELTETTLKHAREMIESAGRSGASSGRLPERGAPARGARNAGGSRRGGTTRRGAD